MRRCPYSRFPGMTRTPKTSSRGAADLTLVGQGDKGTGKGSGRREKRVSTPRTGQRASSTSSDDEVEVR